MLTGQIEKTLTVESVERQLKELAESYKLQRKTKRALLAALRAEMAQCVDDATLEMALVERGYNASMEVTDS